MFLEESNRNNTQLLILNILKQQKNTQSNELKYDIEGIKNEIYPDYSIRMIASKSNIFKSFDSTGKGINNMTNWYLCNGRYKTPNLNKNNNDYKYITYMSETVSGK